MRSATLLMLLGCLASRTAQAERRLSLAEAIRVAVELRPEVTQADIEIKRAKLSHLQAWLELVHVDVQGSASERYQQQNINGPPDVCQNTPDVCQPEAHPFSASATLTVPLWSGLRVESKILRTRWLERAAGLQKNALISNLAHDVASAYWEVRRAELLREILAKALQRHQEVEEITRSRVDAGIVPRVDYTRTHTLVLRDAAALMELDQRLIEARAQLGSVLQIEDPIVLTEPVEPKRPSIPTLPETLDEALQQRPELRVASAEIEAQKHAVREAQGPYWPQIYLSGQAVVTNQTFYSSLYTAPTFQGIQERVILNYNMGLTAQWSVFDTLTTWTHVRDAELARDRLVEDRKRRTAEVSAEVRASHARLTKSIERQKWLQQAVAASRESVDLLRKRYRAGSSLLIELLGAEAELTQVESDLVESAVAIVLAEADLKRALGRPYGRTF